jgi:hypothetical protein
MLAELEHTGADQLSLTDPDSRAMAAHTHIAVGYNVQVAVDTKHKLIVEQQVTSQVLDMGLLTETAEPAKRMYHGPNEVHQSGRACSGRTSSHTTRKPTPVMCPGGQHLSPYSSSVLRGLKKINYVNKQACRDCPLRSRCTNNSFRSLSRMENEAVLDRMQARLAQRPQVLAQRRETVEHPFGTIKQWMNQGAFLMRSLEKVRGEFRLTALAYNPRRVLNIVRFAELMDAVRG